VRCDRLLIPYGLGVVESSVVIGHPIEVKSRNWRERALYFNGLAVWGKLKVHRCGTDFPEIGYF
jgi:hypothetical protein